MYSIISSADKSAAVKDENRDAPSCYNREDRIRHSFKTFMNNFMRERNHLLSRDDFEFLISTAGFEETVVQQRYFILFFFFFYLVFKYFFAVLSQMSLSARLVVS